jgi:hypothetical protein
MPPAPLDRRSLLRTGGMAAGSLALAGGWVLPANATTPIPRPSTAINTAPVDSIVAWAVLDFERGATVRLMQLDGGRPGAELATRSLPPISPAALAEVANHLAVATVSGAWLVAPDSCVTQHGRITHPASGRSIGYGVWVDFA